MEFQPGLIPLALALAIGPQDASLETSKRRLVEAETPADLSLDELIDRLPLAGSEITRSVDGRTFSSSRDVYCEELASRLASGAVLTPRQWERALFDTKSIFFRKRWPADRPYAVTMRIPLWLQLRETGNVLRVVVGPDAQAVEAVDRHSYFCGMAIQEDFRRALFQDLVELPIGLHAIDLQLEHYDLEGKRRTLTWFHPTQVQVLVVPTIDEVLTPRDSHGLSTLIRRRVRVLRDWVSFQLDAVRNPENLEIGLSLSIALQHKRETVATAHLRPRRLRSASTRPGARLQVYDSTRFRTPDGENYPVPTDGDLSRWSLVVQGTTERILENPDATSYWSGRVRIPLKQALKQR